MRKYVIWVSQSGTKYYIQASDKGTEAVSNKADATVLPNRMTAQAVCAAIRPEIKKQGFDVEIGLEVL